MVAPNETAPPAWGTDEADKSEQLGGALGTDYSTSRPVDKLTDRLDKLRETGHGQWIACCPAHEDRTPSLSIRETEDGTVLVKCFAGCGAADVVGAVGLRLADLFPNRSDNRRAKTPTQRHMPRDVLACISTEAVVALIAAETLQRGEALKDEDIDRLALASRRLRNAAREAGCNV